MEDSEVVFFLNNLIDDDVHTTIDHILREDKNRTYDELIKLYDSL